MKKNKNKAQKAKKPHTLLISVKQNKELYRTLLYTKACNYIYICSQHHPWQVRKRNDLRTYIYTYVDSVVH